MSEMLLAAKAMLTSRVPVVEWLLLPPYTRRIAGSNPTRNTCHNLINEETIISDSPTAKIPGLSMIS